MKTANSLKIFLKEKFPKIVYSAISFINNFHTGTKNKIKLMKSYNVEVLLDVGANIGNYSHAIRGQGFGGMIYSFEPLKEPFSILNKRSSKDDNWIAYNYALGDYDGETQINVANDSACSSILEKTELFDELLSEKEYTGKQSIKVFKLDTIYNKIINDQTSFLKIDAQGYEKNILEGANKSLDKIVGIQIELSLKQLYENAILYDEMIMYLKSLGYYLKLIEGGWYSNNELTEFDGIFFKDYNEYYK
jgi:FkbM family methyltransferase